MDESSSSYGNSNGAIPKSEISESPFPSWGLVDSDDSSSFEPVFPRIGEKYQANITSFRDRQCNLEGVTDALCYNSCEHYERFSEGLLVPITRICCSFGTTECKSIPTVNQSPTETSFHQNAPLLAAQAKENTNQPHQPLIQLEDTECIKSHDDSQIIYHNGSCSSRSFPIDTLKDTLSDGMIPDGLFDGYSLQKKRQRRRGKADWKNIKRMDSEYLGTDRCLFGSNSHLQERGPSCMGKSSCCRSHIIVPGTSCASFSKIEKELFTLGLYVFGKDLEAVKRFVGTKKMEDILSYYYGAFFRSESYCRWLQSRKARNKKCVHGQRLFLGFRQEELLARISAHVSEASMEEIRKITRAFNEGRVSLEEYVTKMKLISGPHLFVQAIGIGKGKEDLTTFLVDPNKVNQANSLRHDIPVGKACSSLSSEEILKFLTGDFRLSKARADDLFWEAVWPRLLSRGWHSEQPKDQPVFGSKQPLVFLIPGLHNFSRSLTKGSHYFDSVSDVLNRVASDPRLLELGIDTFPELMPELSWASENIVEEDKQRETFTIVDTSIASANNPTKFWERLALPSNSYVAEFQEKSQIVEDDNNLSSQPSINDQDSQRHLSSNDSEEAINIFVKHEISQTGNEGWKGSRKRKNRLMPSASNCKKLGMYIHSNRNGATVSFGEAGALKRRKISTKIKPTHCSSASVTINNHSEASESPCAYQITSQFTFSDASQKNEYFSANNIGDELHRPELDGLRTELHLNTKVGIQEKNEIGANDNKALVSKVSKFEEACSGEFSGNIKEEVHTSGTSTSSSRYLDENHFANSQENNNSLHETIVRQSKRSRPLTLRALEAYACGFYSTKRPKKGSDKGLSKDSVRMRSVSQLVQKDTNCTLNSEFNAT